MSDTHDEDFAELMGGYQYPIEAWSTGDLVHLANIIDIELQQRAPDEEKYADEQSGFGSATDG